MARRIADQELRGSVARLLSPAVATAALATVESPPRVQPHESSRAPSSPARQRYIKREFILSPEADAAVEELLAALRRATGARLSASQAIRALLVAVRPAATRLRLIAPATCFADFPDHRAARRPARIDEDSDLVGALRKVIALHND